MSIARFRVIVRAARTEQSQDLIGGRVGPDWIGGVTSLLPGGERTRKKRLCQDIEEIITKTLREQWLVLEAPPLASVVAEKQPHSYN